MSETKLQNEEPLTISVQDAIGDVNVGRSLRNTVVAWRIAINVQTISSSLRHGQIADRDILALRDEYTPVRNDIAGTLRRMQPNASKRYSHSPLRLRVRLALWARAT